MFSRVVFGRSRRFGSEAAVSFNAREPTPARAGGCSALWRCRRLGKFGPHGPGAAIRLATEPAGVVSSPPLPGAAEASAADQPNRLPVEPQLDGCAQTVAGPPARRGPWARKGGHRGVTPKAGVESGVDNRRRDSRSWQRGGADVRPSGEADRFASWPGPAASGRALSAPPPGALAAGAANGKGSPAQKAGTTPRPRL